MMDRPQSDVPPLHRALLKEAHEVSGMVLDRLRGLEQRFPATLPTNAIAQMERLHTDPLSERRGTARMQSSSHADIRRPRARFGDQVPILDYSPVGVALRLCHPMDAGAVLLICCPDTPQQIAEVKYCRPDGTGWVVGCEFLRPPQD
jgi:hypothetical protein